MIIRSKNELVLEISSAMGIAFLKCRACQGDDGGVILVPVRNDKPIGPHERIKDSLSVPLFLHFLGERKASTATQYDFISSIRKVT